MKKLLILLFPVFWVCSGVAQNNLEEYLKMVETNNLKLKTARGMVASQKLGARTGITPDNPEIEYEYMPGDVGDRGTMTTLRINQKFDFPTVYAQRSKMARLMEDQAEREYAIQRNDVLLQASQLYIRRISLFKKLNLFEERQAHAEKLLQTFNIKLEQGEASILEVNKLKLELSRAKKQVSLSKSELEKTDQQIFLLNGGLPVNLTSFGFPAYPPTNPDELLRLYQDNDPKLKLEVGNVNISRQEIRVQQNKIMPEISISYSYEKTPDVKYAGPGAGLTIPLWQNANKIKLARSNFESSQAQLAEETESVRSQVTGQIHQLEILGNSLNEMRETLLNVNSAELLLKALNSGEISIITYLNELQYNYQGQEEMLDTEEDYYLMLADLNKIRL